MRFTGRCIEAHDEDLDVAGLLRAASADDLRFATDALLIIRQRGCDRGRDLSALFELVRRELTP